MFVLHKIHEISSALKIVENLFETEIILTNEKEKRKENPTRKERTSKSTEALSVDSVEIERALRPTFFRSVFFARAKARIRQLRQKLLFEQKHLPLDANV